MVDVKKNTMKEMNSEQKEIYVCFIHDKKNFIQNVLLNMFHVLKVNNMIA